MSDAEPLWDYWCPIDPMVHPQELQVGIVTVDDEGMGHPLMVVAIIPPLPTDPPSQAEPFASRIRDLLSATDWYDYPAWARAHGLTVAWPSSLPPLDPTMAAGGEQ
jgi:hypothetical protein